MKGRVLLISMLFFLFFGSVSFAQEKRSIPSANIQTLQGRPFDTKSLDNGDDPIIINFWATWCKPCIRELNSIDDVYDEWKEETGVKFYAISIDDSRSKDRVRPFVNGRGWDYKVYLDPNQNFMRALNVNNPPHTFLVDADGDIVWEHNGYSPGDEDKLYKKLKGLDASEEEKSADQKED